MTQTYWKMALGLLAFAVSSSPANAHQQIPQGMERIQASSFWLSPGEMHTLELGRFAYIQKLFIQAEGRGCTTQFEVLVNGDPKGNVTLPVRDPNYLVTVADTTSQVTFRNTSGCYAQIYGVHMVVDSQRDGVLSRRDVRFSDRILEGGALNRAAGLCGRTIQLVDVLERVTDSANYVAYLLPIKKLAGRVYALANARGPHSFKVNQALRTLQAQIDAASGYIDNTFERSDAFEAAVELLAVREKIDAITE